MILLDIPPRWIYFALKFVTGLFGHNFLRIFLTFVNLLQALIIAILSYKIIVAHSILKSLDSSESDDLQDLLISSEPRDS